VEAVIFIGVQGAGKTTFYRERFFDTHVRISLDLLRTRRRERLIFEACIAGLQPLVVDNTNPLAADRARYVRPARAAGFRLIAYFFETELRDAIKRNSQREREKKVPVAAVVGTMKRMQRPLLEEGFDEIHLVQLTAENRFLLR
jgi:predicted kinase